MDCLNIIFGCATLGSLAFALWAFIRTERREIKLRHLLFSLDTVQTSLTGVISTASDIQVFTDLRQLNRVQGAVKALTNHLAGVLDTVARITLAVRNVINLKPREFAELITGNQLAVREEQAKDVWIITKDLYEAEERLFYRVVVNNLKRGTSYRYIMPDTELLKQKASTLRVRYDKKVDEIGDRYFHLPVHQDSFPFVTEVLIYDANDLMKLQAFWMLPSSSEDDRLYLELDRETTENVCSLFRRLWSDSDVAGKPDL